MPVILEAHGLSKRFGAVVAASDISVRIEQDSVIGLIGTNGAGKTTFVNMVTGYLKPDTGTILHNGQDITGLKPREVTRRGICRSFQIPQLYDSLSVRENLIIGLGIQWRNNRQAATRSSTTSRDVQLGQTADAMLARFGLAAERDRLAGVLPEGVRKLLDIAMALAAQPTVLLLDEPTSGVSTDEKFDIMDRIMTAVRADGVTVLFVEHDMEIVSRYAQRLLAFYDGRILAEGPVAEVLANHEVRLHVIGNSTAAAGTAAANASDGVTC